MDQERLVNRMGAKAPHTTLSEPNEGSEEAGRLNQRPAASPPSWLRNVNDYVRSQPREYQVMRFG